MSSTLLGLLAQHWEPGKVKPRLAATLGESHAATFHALCVTALADRFAAVADSRVIAFAPAQAESAFRCVSRGRWHLSPQTGADVGQRLHAFFTAALAQAERVVLIGSDCPDLPRELVTQAFASLETDDAVLGPTTDGSWYLLGAARKVPAFIEEIVSGSSADWPRTVPRLEPWRHVDDEANLKVLLAGVNRGGIIDPALRMLEAQIETLLRNCRARRSRAG